jgi:hypothetical protein
VRRATVRSRGVHGESGQGTVEWAALVLLAALILGAAASHSFGKNERDLGELVARRMASAPHALERAAGTAAPALPISRGAPASPRAPVAPPRAPASTPHRVAPDARARVVDAFRRLRRVAGVSKHAWIVCLGYERWRQELEHPRVPTQAVPLGEALAIVNDCLNPYDFLFEG